MNLKQRLKKLEEIVFNPENGPSMIVFAVLKEEWTSGDKDFDATGMKFERYIGGEKFPELAKAKDLEELKQLTAAIKVQLMIFPVSTLDDIWAEEREELKNEP